MIIELFGLPGAGKSTLAREMAESPDFLLVKKVSRGELIVYNLVFLCSHPIKFCRFFWQILSNSKSWQEFYYKFMNCFLQQNAKFQKARRAKNAVLDQGYFQNILSVFNEAKTSDFLIKYSRNLFWPDKLIILDLPQDILESRIKSRGYYPRHNFVNKYVAEWSEATRMNYQTFLKNIDSVGIEYIILDGREKTDKLASKII